MPRSSRKQGMGVRAKMRNLKGEVIVNESGEPRRYPRVIQKQASGHRALQRARCQEIYWQNIAAEHAQRDAEREAAMRLMGGY